MNVITALKMKNKLSHSERFPFIDDVTTVYLQCDFIYVPSSLPPEVIVFSDFDISSGLFYSSLLQYFGIVCFFSKRDKRGRNN